MLRCGPRAWQVIESRRANPRLELPDHQLSNRDLRILDYRDRVLTVRTGPASFYVESAGEDIDVSTRGTLDGGKIAVDIENRFIIRHEVGPDFLSFSSKSSIEAS